MTIMHFQILNHRGVYATTETTEQHTKGFEAWKNKRIEVARDFKFKWRLITAERLEKLGNDPLKCRHPNLPRKTIGKAPHALRPRCSRDYLRQSLPFPE